jgi:hypothetical protein
MRRGDLLVVVNAGAAPAELEVGEREVLFETPTGVKVVDGRLAVPGHAGALLR